MLETIYTSYIPNRLIAVSDDGTEKLPLFANRQSDNVLAYLCVNSTCRLPVATAEELKKQLAEINY